MIEKIASFKHSYRSIFLHIFQVVSSLTMREVEEERHEHQARSKRHSVDDVKVLLSLSSSLHDNNDDDDGEKIFSPSDTTHSTYNVTTAEQVIGNEEDKWQLPRMGGKNQIQRQNMKGN